jgi:hypothetical protein
MVNRGTEEKGRDFRKGARGVGKALTSGRLAFALNRGLPAVPCRVRVRLGQPPIAVRDPVAQIS